MLLKSTTYWYFDTSYIHATTVLYVSKIIVSNFFNTKIIQREDWKKYISIELPLGTLKLYDKRKQFDLKCFVFLTVIPVFAIPGVIVGLTDGFSYDSYADENYCLLRHSIGYEVLDWFIYYSFYLPIGMSNSLRSDDIRFPTLNFSQVY